MDKLFNRRLIVFALLFALISNAAAILEFAKYNGKSFRRWSPDDPVYIVRALKVSELRPQNWYYYENDTATSATAVLSSRPNAIVDFLVGSVSHTFSLDVSSIALLLDIVFSFLSFVAFVWLFAQITPTLLPCVSATVVALSFPYAFYLKLPDFTSQLFPFLVSPNYMDVDLPAFRAVYTQVSYPFFGFLVGGALYFIRRNDWKKRHWGLLGLGCGCLCYLYIFPCISAIAIISFLLILRSMLNTVPAGALSFRLAGSCLVHFLAASFVSCLPALLMLHGSGSEGIVEFHGLRSYWFFSSFSALTSILLFALAKRIRITQPVLFATYLLITSQVLEILLMNTQPLVGKLIAPYHFPRFYLQPLCSGSIFLMLAYNLSGQRLALLVNRRPHFRRAILIGAALLLATPICVLIYQSEELSTRTVRPNPRVEDFAQLIDYLKTETSTDSVIAVISDREPFRSEVKQYFTLRNLPNSIYSLSNRYILHQDWFYNPVEDLEDIERELYLGWLFSGKMQLLWPCLTLDNLPLPGDTFFFTWTGYLIRRALKCDAFQKSAIPYTLCDAIKKYRVDYVLKEKQFSSLPWPPVSYYELIWEGKNKAYSLFRYNSEIAKHDVCG